MVLAGLNLDFTSVGSLISTIFAVMIAFESYRVYHRTERQHFLAFSIAFTLLGIAYALLIPLAIGVALPPFGYETGDILAYPPRIILTTISFIVVALSYTPTVRVKEIMYGLVALLIISVTITLIPGLPDIPYSVDVGLFLLHIVLLAYVLFQMSHFAKPARSIFLAFVILLVSQCVNLAYIIQTFNIIFLLSQALRVISFALLFVTLVIASRSGRIVNKKEKSRGEAIP